MFVKFVIGALWLVVGLESALAQDLGTLRPCAAACINAVARANKCILITAQCICPNELDVTRCITRSCPTQDMGSSLTAIDSFCQIASPPPPPPQSSPPVVTPPTPSTSIVTIAPPITPNPQQTTITLPSLTTTPSISSTSLSTTSTISLPSITPTPILPSTSEAPQTVVVFSTQFAPPTSITGNNGALNSFNPIVLYISMILSGIVGILMI